MYFVCTMVQNSTTACGSAEGSIHRLFRNVIGQYQVHVAKIQPGFNLGKGLRLGDDSGVCFQPHSWKK